MKPSLAAWTIVGLSLAHLAVRAFGYWLSSPIVTFSGLALLGFLIGAHSLRQAFGERGYRRIFFWFAVFLLPCARAELVPIAIPPAWFIPAVLVSWGSLLSLVWHFSKHLDLDDPKASSGLFGPSMVKRRAMEGGR